MVSSSTTPKVYQGRIRRTRDLFWLMTIQHIPITMYATRNVQQTVSSAIWTGWLILLGVSRNMYIDIEEDMVSPTRRTSDDIISGRTCEMVLQSDAVMSKSEEQVASLKAISTSYIRSCTRAAR